MPGKPTETGLYADGRAYIRALLAQGVKSEDILLFGHSLGTGVAVQMAQEFHAGGLILLRAYLHPQSCAGPVSVSARPVAGSRPVQQRLEDEKTFTSRS